MKNTGPKTPEGKRRSSRNASRHGLLAGTVVLPGENRNAFNRLLSAYRREYRPVTRTEHDLVDSLTAARWRLMRLWAMETAGMAHEIAGHPDQSRDDHATRAALAFRSLSDNSRSLDLQHRYEARLVRQYNRVLSLLRAGKNEKLPNEFS